MACEKEKSALMRAIHAHSFAVDDLRLFLDTHPDCQEALQALNSHLAARLEAIGKYEKNYGPLTIDGQSENAEHVWINDPWPWEKEG